MSSQEWIELLWLGRLTLIPLGIGSILVFAIVVERLWRYRGIDRKARSLTRDIIEKLVRRDLDGARELCRDSRSSLGEIYLEAMRWKNVALEDLERVLATSRQEAASDLRRGLWVVGTIGSLAPYVGLFGTVVGILRSFQDMAREGAGGFEVVAAGISEALVATAAGLLVAIIALMFFNYLQVRAGLLGATYARSCERFVQALLYVESSAETAGDAPVAPIGGPVTA